jgi:hypothetical protein
MTFGTLILSVAALVASAFSILLVAFWANDNGEGYLGRPNLNENLFAWHPIMM